LLIHNNRKEDGRRRRERRIHLQKWRSNRAKKLSSKR